MTMIYRVMYFKVYSTGFHLTQAEYCIYESEVVMKLRDPVEKKIKSEEGSRNVRVIGFFEEVYITDDGVVTIVQ